MTKPQVLVVACSKAKKEQLAPAIEMYDGPVFRSLRKWQPNIDVLVLSAKYGAIPAHQVIETYDLKMTEDTAIQHAATCWLILNDYSTIWCHLPIGPYSHFLTYMMYNAGRMGEEYFSIEGEKRGTGWNAQAFAKWCTNWQGDVIPEWKKLLNAQPRLTPMA